MQISREDYEKLVGQAKVADLVNRQNKRLAAELEEANNTIARLTGDVSLLQASNDTLAEEVRSSEISRNAAMQGIYSIVKNYVDIYQ